MIYGHTDRNLKILLRYFPLASIALLSLIISVRRVENQILNFDPRVIGNDDVTRTERQFADIRHLLPRSGFLGYVDDAMDEDEADFFNQYKGYFFAQYVLSPVILVNPKLFSVKGVVTPIPEQYLVVSHGQRSETVRSLWNGEQLVRTQDLGNGLGLYRRKLR